MKNKRAMRTLIMLGVLLVPVMSLAHESAIDTGTTAWVLTSTALVLLMVPGLGLFYGGLVRTKNVVGTIGLVCFLHHVPDHGVAQQFWYQIEGVGVSIIYSGVVTLILVSLVDKVFGCKIGGDGGRPAWTIPCTVNTATAC